MFRSLTSIRLRASTDSWVLGVALDDATAEGQAHPRAWVAVARVEPAEDEEDALPVLRGDDDGRAFF